MDDNDDTRLILGLRLQEAGFEVGRAASGKECLTALQTQSWDVVLLDLMMPFVDGFEVLRRLQDQSTHTPLVVVVTQLNDSASRERALALGAAEFVPKEQAFSRAFARTVLRLLEARRA